MIIKNKDHAPELVHVGLVQVCHPQKNEERLFHFYEDVPLMKVLIVFHHCNISFFLPQLQCNKLLQLHSSNQFIFKAKSTHHSKKIICKPGGNWIQKQHLFYVKKPGTILEECRWRNIVSTKDHVNFLGEEWNQCTVEPKGGK